MLILGQAECQVRAVGPHGSVRPARTDVHPVQRERGGVLRRPVPQEERLHLALQRLLTFLDLGAGLVDHQAHAGRLGEVGLGPVGRSWWEIRVGLTGLFLFFPNLNAEAKFIGDKLIFHIEYNQAYLCRPPCL